MHLPKLTVTLYHFLGVGEYILLLLDANCKNDSVCGLWTSTSQWEAGEFLIVLNSTNGFSFFKSVLADIQQTLIQIIILSFFSHPLQHLKDKFWNFIFYKFIFIFGVLNVQTVEEVVMWCLWFSALVFLHLMVQLCKDRFEYVSMGSEHFNFNSSWLLLFLWRHLIICSKYFLYIYLIAAMQLNSRC